MENFRILDPVGDVLVVVKKPADDLFEGDRFVLDLVKIGEDTVPGYLQYEASLPSSSDNESTCTDQFDDQRSYTECARVLVSSKHLSLMSPYLDVQVRMDTNACTKNMKIPDCVHDVEALMVLFNILHCRTKDVPRVIDFRMLVSITALVQRFDCVEAVEVFAHMWIESLYTTLSMMYSPDLPKWIWIAQVYGHEALFGEATRIAIRQSTGPIDLPDFDDAQSLSDTIETLRQESIGTIITQLYDRIEAARQGRYCCGKCDALILGKLVQSLRSRGLYPRSVHPFEGVSVQLLVEALACLGESDCWSFVEDIHTFQGCNQVTGAVVGTDMQELEELCEQVQGLSIVEFNNA